MVTEEDYDFVRGEEEWMFDGVLASVEFLERRGSIQFNTETPGCVINLATTYEPRFG